MKKEFEVKFTSFDYMWDYIEKLQKDVVCVDGYYWSKDDVKQAWDNYYRDTITVGTSVHGWKYWEFDYKRKRTDDENIG
jgi:hypothetical protein